MQTTIESQYLLKNHHLSSVASIKVIDSTTYKTIFRGGDYLRPSNQIDTIYEVFERFKEVLEVEYPDIVNKRPDTDYDGSVIHNDLKNDLKIRLGKIEIDRTNGKISLGGLDFHIEKGKLATIPKGTRRVSISEVDGFGGVQLRFLLQGTMMEEVIIFQEGNITDINRDYSGRDSVLSALYTGIKFTHYSIGEFLFLYAIYYYTSYKNKPQLKSLEHYKSLKV